MHSVLLLTWYKVVHELCVMLSENAIVISRYTLHDAMDM